MFAWDSSFSDFIAARQKRRENKMATTKDTFQPPRYGDLYAHLERVDSATSSDADDAYKEIDDDRHRDHGDDGKEATPPLEPASSFSDSLPPYTDAGIQEYGVYYFGLAHRDLIITSNAPGAAGSETKRPVYYVDVSEFTRHKPDVTLHSLAHTAAAATTFTSKDEISSKYQENELETAPVAGVARFPKFSRYVTFSLGNPESPPSSSSSAADGDVTWREMRPTHAIKHSEYEFSFQGHKYLWQRTRAVEDGVQGPKWRRGMALDNFKLLDVTGVAEGKAAPQVLAVFVNSWQSWRKRGSLRILKLPEDAIAYGGDSKGKAVGEGAGDLETVIFLTCVAILEKARRRANRRRSAGSGGGGGGGGG